MISLICGLLKRKTSTKLIDTENRLVVARWRRVGGGEKGWVGGKGAWPACLWTCPLSLVKPADLGDVKTVIYEKGLSEPSAQIWPPPKQSTPSHLPESSPGVLFYFL